MYLLTEKADYDEKTQIFNYNKTEYSVKAIPGANSGLVEMEITNTFPDVHLDRLINNLYYTADLMFLAYNASMAEEGLAIKAQQRQRTLADLIMDSSNVMVEYSDTCEIVMTKLKKAYSDLLHGREKSALREFGKITKQAEKMVNMCNNIVGDFEVLATNLASDADTVAGILTNQNAQLLALGKHMDELKAKQAKQESSEKTLKVQIQRLVAELAEAKLEAKEE